MATTITHSGASGTLPAAAAALYTAPNPAIAWVSIVNSAAVTRTANIYVNRGTRRRVIPKDLSMQAGDAHPAGRPFGPISLAAGQSIDGDASNAGDVEYVISALELS